MKMLSNVGVRRGLAAAAVISIVLLGAFCMLYARGIRTVEQNDLRKQQPLVGVDYFARPKPVWTGQRLSRTDIIGHLRNIGYSESTGAQPGTFQLTSSSLTIRPRQPEIPAISLEWNGDRIERIVQDGREVETSIIEPEMLRSLVLLRANENEKLRLRRYQVSYEELRRTPFLDALVSSEDARFYDHSGFSIHQTAWAALQGRGGSTLTQQLAKACILRDSSRTYVRKINELAVSLSLERQLSKDRILEAYANCVYFGSTADGLQLYGVGAAAKHLLNKNAAELNLADAATLVALLSAPSYYLRTTRAEEAAEPLRKQRNRVLRLMLRNCPDRYSKADFDAVEGSPVTLAAPPADSAQSNLEKDSRYFLDYLATTLSVDAPGSRVYTTLCADLQRAATASVRSGITRLESRLPSAVRGKLQAALVAITPDGEVLAMVGGRDYGASSYNRATKALLSPGSSIKSFLYVLALDAGRLDGEPVTPATIMNPARGILDGYRPTSHVGGLAPLRMQFARSDNGAAVLTASMRPPQDYVDFLNQAIGTRLVRASGPMFIGGAAHTEVTPLDLALGYSMFANAGKKGQPRVAVALYKDSERLPLPGPSPRPLVRPEAAFVMAQVMRSVSGDGPMPVSGATAGQAKLAAGLNDQVQVAAKTGTAQEGHAVWFAAVLPRLVVVSAAFTDDNMSTPFAGADVAREIWVPFIREAAQQRADLLTGSFTQPENVVVRNIDPRRGCLTEHGGVPEYFIANRLPAACSLTAITAAAHTAAAHQVGRRR